MQMQLAMNNNTLIKLYKWIWPLKSNWANKFECPCDFPPEMRDMLQDAILSDPSSSST